MNIYVKCEIMCGKSSVPLEILLSFCTPQRRGGEDNSHHGMEGMPTSTMEDTGTETRAGCVAEREGAIVLGLS